MPKKTKRQKLHADKHRAQSVQPSRETREEVLKSTPSTPYTYTFSGVRVTKEAPTVVSADDQRAYTAMTKDITKTVVIALFIFAAQAVLYWKLRI